MLRNIVKRYLSDRDVWKESLTEQEDRRSWNAGSEAPLVRLQRLRTAAEYILTIAAQDDRSVMLGCLARDLKRFSTTDRKALGAAELALLAEIKVLAAKARGPSGRRLRKGADE